MPVVVGTSGQMALGGGTGVEQLCATHQSVAPSVYSCVSRDEALLSFCFAFSVLDAINEVHMKPLVGGEGSWQPRPSFVL